MTDFLDVYEMTPMQAGMLFQSLYELGQGSYVQQYWGRLEGPLDAEAFRDAWSKVIARHDILRAACHWEDLDRPTFAIHHAAPLSWYQADWNGTDEARLEAWLVNDRTQGFDMTAPPLMRFALIPAGTDAHVFVWTFHHLLLDGWCGALLVREALTLYAGTTLPDPAPPFRRYLDWLGARDCAADEQYWRAALAGIDGPTPLGIDRAATGQDGTAEHRFRLTPELSEALTRRAQASRLTLATLMQGAWGLVLSRYCGTDDVIFGNVMSGRPADLPGAEAMVGMFLNTVPLRLRLGDETLEQWMATIQTAQREAEAHGHVSLADLRVWAGLGGVEPLFESLLIVESYPESITMAAQRGDHALRLTASGIHERTNFPLMIKVLPGTTPEICLSADTSRIPSEMLAPLEGHLTRALKIIAEQFDAPVAGIDVLSEIERQTLIQAGRGPMAEVSTTVPERLRAQAEARPEETALVIPNGDTLSYRALWMRAGQIAGGLIARGIGPGDIVAVCQDRSADLLASLIAIWRCGAAYLPLDPSFPSERIAYILSDAGAALLLVDEAGAAVVGDGQHIVQVGDCTGPPPQDHAPQAEDLAYILYTSGSTGRPKGVPISHEALANFLTSMLRSPGLTACDRLLAVTTVSFDIAGLELFGPLLAGGRVVLAPTGAGIDGKGIARLIDAHAVTVMQATPAGWRVLRDSGWAGRPGFKMLSGGEALDSGLAADLLRLGGTLWNLYGPTETTIWSGALRVTPDHLNGPTLPVGGPLDNTTLTLHDAAGCLVPMGVSGELWIGGKGLSPGYLDRPELTADRFVTRNGTRFYRTGDRMRQRADGTFDFLGRFDHQVKLRGFRIELGEIERQLEQVPGVAQALVMIRGDGNDARLMAWLRGDDLPQGAQIRQMLSTTLPAYMVPGVFIPLERFPLTPNGKIDRKALPDPERSVATPVDRDQRAMVAASIWAEVLGSSEPGPEDDFFALGGHSLSALRVIGEVRQLLGAEISLRDLFDAPRFAAFCATIERASGRPTLPPVTVSDGPALSAAQGRQWLLSRLDPRPEAYHLSLGVRLSGPLDRAALVRALSRLAQRHTILRCRFPERDGQAMVEMLPEYSAELLCKETDPVDAATLARIRDEEAGAPFDMGQAPPWRARLVPLGPTDHALILTLHHILCDEGSFAVLLDELAAGYRGDARDPLAIQYGDFARWQDRLDLNEQAEFWAQELNGAPAVTLLPTDRDRPSTREARTGRATLTLDLPATEALEDLARACGTTLYMTVLAAYAVLLSRHSGQSDVVIGTPVTNRRLPAFQPLVGLFVNTLAIRADMTDAQDFAEVLERVRGTVLAALDHQDLPFEGVIDRVAPSRDALVAPIFQTFFAMPDVPMGGEIAPGLTWAPLETRPGPARFDLTLEITHGAGGLSGHFDYAADLFDAATMDRLARRMERLLSGLADAADLPLADLPLLSDADISIALPAVQHPAATSEAAWLHLRDPEGRCLVFDHRLRDHLRAVAEWLGPVERLSFTAAADTVAGFAARTLALACGAVFDESGSADAVQIDATRQLSLGQVGQDVADLMSVPELPFAFERDGTGLRPLPGVWALVLDADGGVVPPGAVGRLAIGGAGLARGYLDDPTGTATRFGPNPFADPAVIDPAEICLLHTDIHARQTLDGRIILCDPREPVQGLGQGAPSKRRQTVRPEAPRDGVETVLAAIWQDVLGVPVPSRHAGFFDLGGDSVRAIQVASRLTDRGFDLDPRALFRLQTLAELAPEVLPSAPATQAPPPPAMDVDLDALADLVSFGDD